MIRLQLPTLRPWQLITLVSICLLALYNNSFWLRVDETMRETGHSGWALKLALFLTLTGVMNLLFGLFSQPRWLLRGVLALLFFCAASASMFMDQFSVVIDQGMIDNALQTDPAEVSDLMSGALILRLLLTGLLPAALILIWPLRAQPWQQNTRQQLALLSLSLVLIGVTVGSQYRTLSIWGREHRDLRVYLNPSYPLYSAVKAVRSSADLEPPKAIALDARQIAPPSLRPFVTVLVVGETARADHFSLNGYERDTNPRLRQRAGVVSFTAASSCSTDTAHSLPCMFSRMGRPENGDTEARAEESLLDVLHRAGVDVTWRDNNSGCKGACDRVDFETVELDLSGERCGPSGCFDEALLNNFDALITPRGRSKLVVLHQKGSHGPTYYRRYPETFDQFRPACESSDLLSCDAQSIVNAYDNSLLYTDFVLDQIIARLEARSHELDSALLYVSDHGESLGENGIYLHGLPYRFAPDAQTHIPMIYWSHSGHGVPESNCLARLKDQPRSHDELFHSMLGLFRVSTAEYRPELDLFRSCHTASLETQLSQGESGAGMPVHETEHSL